MAYFLPTVNDKFQVTTSAAGQVDVVAEWADLAGTTVTPGRQITRISTVATTDVVPAPAASTTRNVKTLSIGNNHGTIANTVGIQITDGTNTVVVESTTLLPGERIAYNEESGIRVFDSLGREKIGSGPGLPGGAATSDVVANAADTYLLGDNVGGRLVAGCGYEFVFRATKTAAGVATPVFTVRTGTAGTTADAARATLTSTAAQTAVADTAMFYLDIVWRQVGASALLACFIRMDHTAADGAGMGTFRYLQATSANFDATPLGTILGVSCNPGASGVWTFQLDRRLAYGLAN